MIHTDVPKGSARFYDEIERRRDEVQPFLLEFADFAETRGLSGLEIGVGIDTEGPPARQSVFSRPGGAITVSAESRRVVSAGSS